MKKLVWLMIPAAVVLSGGSALAFSLAGPIGNNDDAYQVPSIGYNLPFGEVTAPKRIGQEYRRNTPVMYYAADASFLNYFGARGMTEVDKAFAIFNNITNVSLYSSNLFEFPNHTELINQRAAALSLTDLKSFIMGAMTEQLGFFQPARAVWMLRNRITSSVPCPLGNSYVIIKRNIGIVTDPAGEPQYTSYVNDTLYTYYIYEDCGTPAPPPDADAVEYPVDPLGGVYTAVADWNSAWYSGLNFFGGYYTGLTRDDVGLLRYLLSTNNFNLETSGTNTVQFTTNAQPTTLTNFDLNVFASQAATNGPAALNALYPDLLITSSSNYFALGITTNITEILVNSPLDPAGLAPTHPLLSTNYTTNVLSLFSYTFGNLITNAYSTRGLVGTVTLSETNAPFAPAGSLPTVVTNARFSFQSGVFGSFFLLPTNLCSYQLITNLFTQVIATTNLPTGINIPSSTNVVAGSNNLAVVFVPGSITFFTNLNPVILPVTCPADTIATRRGVEKLTFIRRDFDSLINQFWEPVTNDYTLYALTNGFVVPQHMRRVVTVPDFLFEGSDFGGTGLDLYSRNVIFDQTTVPTNSAGPGTIESPSIITLNDTGPSYGNAFFFGTNTFFLSGPLESSQVPILIWGSFDGSTNEPVVYPSGTSISDLENMLYGPSIVQSFLPNGEIGAAYSSQLTGEGGLAPYTISLAPGSGLPTGLNLTPDGQISGTPSGPAATYDFTIRVTDANGSFKDIAYTLTIDP